MQFQQQKLGSLHIHMVEYFLYTRNALSVQFHELEYIENQDYPPNLIIHMDQYHRNHQNKRLLPYFGFQPHQLHDY